ncbi:helix-turn-helix transcriptional regulator [Streptomyces rhizosphaericus]|uniref:Helix-turn-helix transcriptional regulator n=1 Tax=Streptomyces rhizosphaericus TaxID=114699 RepID=A0A6G4AHR3_9ACTN|nr:helix-turn-helix transcriptional regulator [Streptomyces rhizosphaericus]NEW72883.1 helix-turn-helix transcriptional regulator [Streptomyces rhizosphaericus]
MSCLVGAIAALVLHGPLREPARLPDPLEALAAHTAARWRVSGPVPLRLDDLATGAGVSSGHLSRLCRAAFDCGPVAALETVRLIYAGLLLRGGLTVRQVARQAGFEDPLYFSRRFRALYGASPSRYRDMAAEAAGPGPRVPAAVTAVETLAFRLLGTYERLTGARRQSKSTPLSPAGRSRAIRRACSASAGGRA